MISDIPAFIRAVTLATIFLAACARPEIGPDQAQSYFVTHRAALEHVIEQIQLCQPDSGKLLPTDAFQCHSPEGSEEELRAAFVAADAKWVRAFYDEREEAERSLYRVMIAMPSSYGMSYAGVIEAFIYEPAPTERAAYERHEDDLAVTERMPVTDSPHHWYWWRIRR